MTYGIVGREFYDKAIRERDEAYEHIAEMLAELDPAKWMSEWDDGADRWELDEAGLRDILRPHYAWLVVRHPQTKARVP